MYKFAPASLSISLSLFLLSPVLAADDDRPSAFKAPVVSGPNGAIANQAYIRHGEELFEKKLYKVTDGVYNVAGYGLSTATMIEGDTGLIIIDTGDSIELASDQMAEFRKISDKPVKAVIYTHFDYALGTKAYIPEGSESEVQIWAHKNADKNINSQFSDLANAFLRRAMIQMGTFLPSTGADSMPNIGMGAYLFDPAHPAATNGYMRATHEIDKDTKIEIDGVKIELIPMFSDTDCTIGIYLPEKGVLHQNVVWSVFYNMYTLRGARFRDPTLLLPGLDRMLEINPEHLLSVHNIPISGKDQVRDITTVYRDSIQFVYDQTVRGINDGLSPEEIVERTTLPNSISENRFTQQFYGELPYYIKGVYGGLIGWFGNDTVELHPLSQKEEATRLVDAMGGRDRVMTMADRALQDDDYQWAAKLSTYLLRIDPEFSAAAKTKAAALRKMGQSTPAANTRAWYLTHARHLEGQLDWNELPLQLINENVILQAPAWQFVNSMRFSVRPESLGDASMLFGIRFTDANVGYGLHLRNGIAAFLDELPPEPDLAVELDRKTWAKLLAKSVTVKEALKAGDLKLTTGDDEALARFLAYFGG